MTNLEIDAWRIERRQSDGVFEYVAFLDGDVEVGVGRWDIALQEWVDLPDGLSALTPDLAEQLRVRAAEIMRSEIPRRTG